MTVPLVSVVTPTWNRHDLLAGRCIPSVQAQDYPAVEHVIVSDEPDPDLAAVLDAAIPAGRGPGHPAWCYEMPEHDPEARWGHWARLRGTELAKGEYITYCDDDDALRPGHCRLLAAALDASPGAGFAYAQVVMHTPGGAIRIGTDPPRYGQVSVTLMHRRELLDVATWRQGEPTIDWDLVSCWLDAGTGYVMAAAVTADIWPSLYR